MGVESSPQNVGAGIPQGSILGPLLFLIFINNTVEKVENAMFLFADDSSALLVFSDIDTATTSINRGLHQLSNRVDTSDHGTVGK